MSRSKARHAKQRNAKKRRVAQEIVSLARRNPRLFKRVWAMRIQSWLEEIDRRRKNLQRLGPATIAGPRIYQVYYEVDNFLLQNPQIDRLVGEATRPVLLNACASAVARALDPRMYKLAAIYRPL
ncbi:MAG TPA: hypothetical protein VJ464_12580 [Blastocatellia bacterium]|nr:hypothetical protein [Blastocatellia bacterium]